ncbi:RNA polymerase sigma factor [Gracilibacillus suaedae]|uniref:RNA polymerase sigma factor n=1 Tax=Gracilibacillus suaedae TaxID=2820273 RepID=UPI001ABDECC6|nr:sigma-70 family RNA polymerase sigma factor [Gracilibacillus suaedae]
MGSIDQIYQKYFKDIYRFLLSLCHDHYTAEDIVQETFLRAYLYLELYDNENVKTWLFTVAYRSFIDHYRKQKKSVSKEGTFFHRIKDPGLSLYEQLLLNAETKQILIWIKELPKKQQHAIILHDLHGLSYKEAATVMNVKLSHYKVLLFRGRQAIRERKKKDE